MKRLRLATLARAACILAPAALLALHRIDSSDMWFHLATGRWILEHGGLPAGDPFAAYPAGTRWLVHDWLGGVGLYLLYLVGSAPALVLGCAAAAVAALACALAGRMTEPQRRWREWSVLAATLLAYERFFVRPEIVTLFLAALFTRLATRTAWSRRSAVALIAAQVVWANTHAGFVLGPAIFWLAVAGRGFGRGRRDWMLPAALTAACLVTPYGWRTWAHALGALRTAHGDAVRIGIAEWQPTFSGPWTEDVMMLLFALTLAAIGLSLWRGRSRLDAFDVSMLVGMSALACAARRHVPLFALTALPIAADLWSGAGATHAARSRFARLAVFAAPVVALALAFDIARGAFYARFGPPRELGLDVAANEHCIAAGDFVARHRLVGPLFNNVAAGSVLGWRLQGEPRVFVDGRLLDRAHFENYRRILNDPAAFDAGGFRLVVLALRPHAPLQLLRHLARSPDWRLGFMDATGAVFVHVEALRDRSDVVPWDLATALPPISSIDCDRSALRSRGVLLTQIGCAAAGATDLERVLRACENRWEVGLELATALNAAGRSAEARPLVERALERAPHSSTAWVEWGWLLGASGDVAGARAAWERARTLHPVDPRAARLLESAPRP
jgi:tetratricopeptide (TPR) repeat protein